MKLVLFVILFAFSAFAAEVAVGSNAADLADGSFVRSGALSSLLVSAQAGSFNADSVMAAEASGEKSSDDSDEEDCEGDDCDDDCEGEDCDDDSGDSDGEDVANSSEDSATADSIVKPKSKNIPLPRQTAYTGKGLSIGIGAGVYNPTEDCDCMGIWQGQLEYFYKEWVSLSIDVRFFGGDLDSDVMVMYQRYRLNLRFHKAWEKLALFVEPVLGFENTSISEFRDEIRHHGKQQTETTAKKDSIPSWVASAMGDTLTKDTTKVVEEDEPCERMLSLDGFSVGVGAGVGFNLSRLWGLTGNILFEYNFSRTMQLSLVPGVAFNLREVWPWAKKNLLSTWISLEFGAQRYFNKGVGEWSNYGFLGFQLGI